MHLRRHALVLLAALIALSPVTASALETVSFRRDNVEQTLEGRYVTKAQDGGMLLETTDGRLWAIQPDEIVSQKNDDRPFTPLTVEQLGAKMLKELPEGFQVHTTTHYVVCYNTSRAYAQWCGGLLERLYRAFTNFWQRKGFKLHEPEFPLVVVIFSDNPSYIKFTQGELGEAASAIIAYYSLRSNRVTMYDLTGAQAIRSANDRRSTSQEVNDVLSRPAAQPMVATIIHEATHQIAFNCGLQTRYADIPLWVSEGIAVYFETPDLSSSSGWRGIGGVNRPRLDNFLAKAVDRPAGYLTGLLRDDKRMRDVKTAADAYSESWALTYYLIRRHGDDYVKYLAKLSEKPPLVWDEPDQRLADFHEAFGLDLGKLETKLQQEMQKVR